MSVRVSSSGTKQQIEKRCSSRMPVHQLLIISSEAWPCLLSQLSSDTASAEYEFVAFLRTTPSQTLQSRDATARYLSRLM